MEKPEPILQHMCGPPMEIILEHLDFRSICRLRRVCQQIKRNVDHVNVKFKFDSIAVQLNNRSEVTCTVQSPTEIYTRRFIRSNRFLEKFAKGFKEVISIERSYPITLAVILENKIPEANSCVAKLVANVLSEHRFLVRKLFVDASAEKDVITIFDSMNPETIEVLELADTVRRFTIGNIMYQPNWSRLKKFYAPMKRFEEGIFHLLHLRMGKTFVMKITLEVLLEFFRIILERGATRRQFFSIDYRKFPKRNELMKAFNVTGRVRKAHKWLIKSSSQTSGCLFMYNVHNRLRLELEVFPFGQYSGKPDNVFVLED